MASGNRRVRINTQERAVSTDINRLQTFQHQDMAELFRAMLNVYVASDDDQLGTVTEPNTVETPLRAEIINGILVKPQGGSLNLLIDPGVLYVMSPDAAADESNYKYIRDAGITVAGTLVMTANASGSTRIDVIECRVNPTEASVTDSRDIFNTTTGLFSAATITKELQGRLEYRVRAGTPGSGMPANQSGWLPLCVASVPTATTSVDTVTFWDVRPMVSDRVDSSLALYRREPRVIDANVYLDCRTTGGVNTARGFVNVVDLKGRRIGGRLRRGVPGTDADNVNLVSADHQSPALTLGMSDLAYVYLATPFGLPRWARYTDGPSGRLPRSPRGILIVTDVAPQHMRPVPNAAISLPTSTGLGSSTSDAICIACLPTGATSGGAAELYGGRIINDTQHLMSGDAFAASTNTTVIPATSLGGGSFFYWDLVAGTHFPANAKSLFVRFTAEWSLPGFMTNPLAVVCPGGASTPYYAQRYLPGVEADDAWGSGADVELALYTLSGGGGAGVNVRVGVTYGGSLTTPTSAQLRIEGWKF